jgi:hypothetical protein
MMSDGDDARNTDSDWENRVLCSDESCIGTIGPDGRCNECGRPYEGQLPGGRDPVRNDQEAAPSDEDRRDDALDTGTGVPDERGAEKSRATPADDEWERRTLCVDENCIGVIGPDGRCKECGKPFARKS